MAMVRSQDFHTVHKGRISEEIIEQVHDLITSGRLAPGDRLPAERELAQILSVGRSTVREAIRVMESMGLVRVRAGEGTFLVGAPTEESAGAAVSLLRSWDVQHKLFEVRRAIEPDLAALAARRATPHHLARMRAMLDEQQSAIGRGENGMKADSAFHYLIAEASRNEVLVRIMDDLMERLQETRQSYLRLAGRPAFSLKQHRAILKAIEARNVRAAERCMLAHLHDMENLTFHSHAWQPAADGTDSGANGGVAP